LFSFFAPAEIGAIQHLMKTYRNFTISLADACLVRMAVVVSLSKSCAPLRCRAEWKPAPACIRGDDRMRRLV
jgi:hypothetical protein